MIRFLRRLFRWPSVRDEIYCKAMAYARAYAASQIYERELIAVTARQAVSGPRIGVPATRNDSLFLASGRAYAELAEVLGVLT